MAKKDKYNRQAGLYAAGGALATGAAGGAAYGVQKARASRAAKVRRARKLKAGIPAALLAAATAGLVTSRKSGASAAAAKRARENLRRGGVGAFGKNAPSGIGEKMRWMNEQNLKRRGMGKKASQVGNADMGAFSDEFVKIIEKRAAIQNLIPGAIRASKFVRHPEEAMRGHDRLSRLGDWYVDRVNKKAIRAAKKKKRGDDILKALTGAK